MRKDAVDRWYRSYLMNVSGVASSGCAALVGLGFTYGLESRVGQAIAWLVTAAALLFAGRCCVVGIRIGPSSLKYRGFFTTRHVAVADIIKVEFTEVDDLFMVPMYAAVVTVRPKPAGGDEAKETELVIRSVASYAIGRWKNRTVAHRVAQELDRVMK